ncbi:MAG: adenine phosphoribosyltransferase [Actinomycetota bacterium]
MSESHERWKQMIRSVKDFPEPGIDFKDITPLLADARALREVVDEMAERHSASRIDAVCGIEARGFILAAPVALKLGAGFVPIRKHGKLPHRREAASYQLEYAEAVLEIHADAVSPGDHVLIVDDVLATGGTARAAADLVQRLGATVSGVTCLIELGFLDGRAKLPGLDTHFLINY